MKTPPKNTDQFQSLVQLTDDLRSPEGCPWDKEQTHQSLTPYAIEEVFELVEAIEQQDDHKLKEELGDVLLQVVLHAQLAKERNAFSISDVIQAITEKMIFRHPHVYGDVSAQSSSEVLKNWEDLKKSENKKTDTSNPLNVPPGMPALQRAAKIGFRTNKLQFDWPSAIEVWGKVEEEVTELEEALESEKIEDIKNELGDVLFTLAQLARHLDLDPEQIGRQANLKFEKRFITMMDLAKSQGRDFVTLSLEEKEKLWLDAKKVLAK